MNKSAALASLGLSGAEDSATVARIYGERLTAVQEKLVTAGSDADRTQCQSQLAELVEAYELVTATGRYTQVRGDDASATVVRSTEVITPAAHTTIRMEPGAVLSDRLEIGALLGQGGMGNVYAARDRLKDQDVAIKVLRQDLLFSTAAKERFLAEAKVSCSLSHPNIVRVHDVGLSGNYYYFSMERLKGHTLRQRIDAYDRDNREFGVLEVTDIARQLIDALRYAHRYIVHRDIKPENIWLAEDGTVKLMDFGIARAYSNSQLTQTGMTLGTAYYMAPEQRVAAKEVDWRADQYALGVVLYELLAGTLPTGAVKPLESVRPDLPKRYARALMRAMSSKPQDRFASLNELLAEIEAPQSKMPLGRVGVLLAGAGVAAAAVGAFILFGKPAADVAPEQLANASEPAQAAPAESTTHVAAQAPAQTPPPSEPPPAAEAAQVAAVPVVNSEPAVAAATPVANAGAADAAESGRSQRVATVDQSGSVARRQECVRQCERDDGECRSLSRRGKQDCMRAVGFGSDGRMTMTNSAATSCAFYGRTRCDRAFDQDACLARIAGRYRECVAVFGGNVASRRQDCDKNAHEADQLCLGELRDCRAACE